MRRYRILGQWLLWAGMLGACASAPQPSAPGGTPTRPITLFRTPTPSPIPVFTTPVLAATITPLPSPTPFSYTIASGDTLLAIAFRFGVSVDEILKVNPGIDPGFLSVGASLIIPIGDSGTAFLPTPTPVPLIYGSPQCYQTGDPSLWCFMPVLNENSAGLEGVQGHIDLYNARGELLTSQAAESPINIIPPGEALPLVAYFPGAFEPGTFSLGFISGAFVANNTAGRYLGSQIEIQEIIIADPRNQVNVRGRVSLLEDGAAEALEVSLVVVAVAHGTRGEVAGLRKWEWQGRINAGQSVPFDITVYSLGPGIERVEAYAEARPSFQPDQAEE